MWINLSALNVDINIYSVNRSFWVNLGTVNSLSNKGPPKTWNNSFQMWNVSISTNNFNKYESNN